VEQAADAAVNQACRMLRLPTLRGRFPDVAEAAARDQMSFRGFLAELLMAECCDRARRRFERRIKAAAFPWEKSMWGFDFEATPRSTRLSSTRRPPATGQERACRSATPGSRASAESYETAPTEGAGTTTQGLGWTTARQEGVKIAGGGVKRAQRFGCCSDGRVGCRMCRYRSSG
jgi:hypothetical protein